MAQQTTVKGFLQAIQTQLAALEASPGVLLFGAVHVTPVVAVDNLLRYGRWPAVIIGNGGGKLADNSKKIWHRRFSITVVTCTMRDALAQQTGFELEDLGDAMLDAIDYSTADALMCYNTEDEDGESLEKGQIVAWKRYDFSYRMRRS